MPISSYRFIEPRILSSISDLTLLAKTVVDGFMLGVHQSPKPGAGLEFSQFRSYEPGDDPRRIDWKLYARSDRYYVRESEIETSVSIRFILDASASMLHEDSGISKFNYARFLVASLGYLAHQQGDAIGFYGLNNKQIHHLAPKRQHQHLHRFLHELENLEADGIWPNWSGVERLFTISGSRELVVVVSDMHEQNREILEVMSKLVALKNEVILFHIMGRNELEFSFQGSLTFEDLETGSTLQVNADEARKEYLKKIQADMRSLRKILHDQHIDYQLFTLDQPLDFALRDYLARRESRVV